MSIDISVPITPLDCSMNINILASNEWVPVRFDAHKGGVSAVSWAPSSQPLSSSNGTTSSSKIAPRFVSGGFDNMIKVCSHSKYVSNFVILFI